MARGPIVPAEKRQEMIDYAMANDVDAAVEKYGVKKRTLRSWLSRAGLASDVSEKRQKAIDAARDAKELQLERIDAKLRNKMESLLDDFDSEYRFVHVSKTGEVTDVNIKPLPADKARLATAFGILFDKNQLRTGGPTVNSVTHTPDLKGLVEAQKEKNEVTKAALIAAVTGEGS